MATLPTLAAIVAAPILFFVGANSLALVALGVAVSGIGVVASALRNVCELLVLRPHVFVGWPFGTAGEHASTFVTRTMRDDISLFVLQVAAFLWPTWGVVLILPPLTGTPFSQRRERSGARGSQWPFVFRVRPPDHADRIEDAWKAAVRPMIEKCAVAIFDCRQQSNDNLRWEIETAEHLLGKDSVCLICLDDDGRYSLTVAGKALPASPHVNTLESSRSDVAPRLDVLATIRGWVAERVPVHADDLREREHHALMDRFICRFGNLLIVGGLGVALFGFFRGAASFLR